MTDYKCTQKNYNTIYFNFKNWIRIILEKKIELNYILENIIDNSLKTGNFFFIKIVFKEKIKKTDINFVNHIKDKLIYIVRKIDFWTFLSIDFEEDKNGNIYLYCFLSIKCTEDQIFFLIDFLKNNFNADFVFLKCDSQVESKNKIKLCFKNIEKNFDINSFYFLSKFQEDVAELIDFLCDSFFEEADLKNNYDIRGFL